MKILVAEDDSVTQKILTSVLQKDGYEVLLCPDGIKAWEKAQADPEIDLCVFDWMMPGMSGVDLCRKIRETPEGRHKYILLLTAKNETDDIVLGLQAGADDYLTKPFRRNELLARLQVGVRMLELQKALAKRVKELEEALSEIRTLKGLLPICSYCKKIRSDDDSWSQMESYISKHSDAEFTHGICPACEEKLMKEIK